MWKPGIELKNITHSVGLVGPIAAVGDQTSFVGICLAAQRTKRPFRYTHQCPEREADFRCASIECPKRGRMRTGSFWSSIGNSGHSVSESQWPIGTMIRLFLHVVVCRCLSADLAYGRTTWTAYTDPIKDIEPAVNVPSMLMARAVAIKSIEE